MRRTTVGALGWLCVAAAPLLIIGCTERVVGRQGIGAEETHPTVSEKEKSDRVSDWIWGEDK